MKRFLFVALMGTALMAPPALAETSANAGARASTQTTAGASLSRGELIQVQNALSSQGFYKGSADGIWGPNTANAVQRFQAQHQINAGGKVDAQTLDQLGVNLSMNANAGSETNSQFEERESARGSTVNPGNDASAGVSVENSSSTGADMANPATAASSAEQRSVGGIDVEVGPAGSGND
jgi:peptidoglycan hydrolase-like protein with peptidoglycan-binding domain